jgi:hypothetical protein
MTRVRGEAAAAVAILSAGLFVTAAAGQSGETSCSGALTDVTVQALVVPAGETCMLANATVAADVSVEQDATLIATDIVVGDDVRVRSEAWLDIEGADVQIGGNVTAHDPARVTLHRSGGTFHVGGDVRIAGANERGALLSGLTVDGDVRISRSGAELGVTLQLSEIGGSAAIVDNTIVGEEFRSAIFVIGNTVTDDLTVSRNDATNAFEPTLIVGNLVLHGDLVCRNNVLGVVKARPGLEDPNVVVEGEKFGQCADF